jgi:hypothetical protein
MTFVPTVNTTVLDATNRLVVIRFVCTRLVDVFGLQARIILLLEPHIHITQFVSCSVGKRSIMLGDP